MKSVVLNGAVLAADSESVDRSVQRSSVPEPLGHIPALDGVRAVAVIVVVLYHGGWGPMTGGFVGVEVFFVLSGFLITRLLVDEWVRSATISLGAFYRRRAVRLLPAFFALVAGVWVVAALVETPGLENRLGYRTMWALSYLTNWHDVVTGTTGGAFSHLWSLAIEEQFYAVWPVVVVFGLRHRGLGFVRRLAAGATVVTALVASWRHWTGTSITQIYFSTESHGAVLLFAGSTLGALPSLRIDVETARRWLILSLVGLGALCLSPYRSSLSFAPTGYAPVILIAGLLLVGAVNSPNASVLSSRPFVTVGRVSYGIYLWHLPMIRLAADLTPSSIARTTFVLTTVAVTASWWLVERPAQRWRTRPGAASHEPRPADGDRN